MGDPSWLVAALLFLALHWTHRHIEDKLHILLTKQRKLIKDQQRALDLFRGMAIITPKGNPNEDRDNRA